MAQLAPADLPTGKSPSDHMAVLADVRKIGGFFPSVNHFETRSLPFVVAINCSRGMVSALPPV